MFKLVLVNLCESTYGFGPTASEYLRVQIISDLELADKVQVEILFLEDSAIEESVIKIADSNPDLVGFSCYSWNIEESGRVSKQLKEQYPDLTIIWGGCSFNMLYKRHDWFEWWDVVDAVAVGAGESIIVSLLKKILADGFTKAFSEPVDGIISNSGGELKFGKPLVYPKNLDDYASPYLLETAYPKEKVERPFIRMEIGCSRDCSYCSDSRSARGGVWLKHSKQRLIDEHAEIVTWPNVSVVDVGLASANFKTQYFADICDIINKSDPTKKLKYSFQMDPAYSKPEQRKLLEGINVERLCFGVQSVTPSTWKLMRRKTTMRELKNSLQIYNGFGEFYISLILGLPGETFESFKAMFDELKMIEGLFVAVHRLLILPGTDMHARHEACGLTFDKNKFYRVTSSQTMSASDLLKAQDYVLKCHSQPELNACSRIDWSNFDSQAKSF